MNFDWKRWKVLDYVVLVACVLAFVGVGLTWWNTDTGFWTSRWTETLEGAGFDANSNQLEEMFTGIAFHDKGVDFNSIVFCLVLVILAFLVVAAKPFFPAGKALSKWYMEALAIMVFGGVVTLITILRLAIAPERGHSAWNPGAGGFVTLIAGLVMLGAGYMMWRDKTGAYGKSVLLPKRRKITTNAV
jgi:hypothetical protein